MKRPDPQASVPRAAPGAGDDPFVRSVQAGADDGAPGAERSVTIVGPLAQRDPDAPPEDTGELGVRGAASFDDLLASARRGGFLAGAAVGALVAGLGAVGVAWATSRPAPIVVAPAEPTLAAREPPAIVVARPDGSARSPAPPAHAEVRTARAPAKRRAPAPGSRDAPAAPGLFLRPVEEPPRVAPGPQPAAEGAGTPARRLEHAEVVTALSGRREELAACGSAHPVDVAAAGGRRFHLVLTIDARGAAAAQLDDPAIAATGLGACLLRAVADVRFAPFDGDPVRVDLPLRFAGPG